jgi:hypothetical protein
MTPLCPSSQRYPRKLPGADELEAEWNALWNWDWDDGQPPGGAKGIKEKPAGGGGQGKGGGGGEETKTSTVPVPVVPPYKENSRLEDMGVNVNGYRKQGHK